MTLSEYYTYQFYTWEFRGRGWFLADAPVHLEPPFIPFFRHGYPRKQRDDGKRPTLLSKAFEAFKGGTKEVVKEIDQALDYQTLEPYAFEGEIDLECLVIKLPKQRKNATESMKALLVMLSNFTDPISFEVTGTATDIRMQFVSNGKGIDALSLYFSAFFPNYSSFRSENDVNIFKEELPAVVIDFGLKHEFVRPIQISKTGPFDSLIGVFSALEHLSSDESGGMQILFQPTVNQWSESILRSVTHYDGSSFFYDSPEALTLASEKVKSPLYGVTIRAFAQADTLNDAADIVDRISHGILQAGKGNYNELIPLTGDAYDFQTRADDIFFRESHRLGMLLSLDELVTFLHFPSESIISKKLHNQSRITKGVPTIARHKSFQLGTNTHDGITENVTVSMEDRLKHTHIIGATGTGKSTLIANMVLQDITDGIGVVVFDPHGDLIDDIIAALPHDKIQHVVLIDPSDIEYPIGVNILEAHSDIEKEVLSSDLVAAFRKYATSWGDQMSTVLGNAILAILESTQGGSMHDLRRFLLEKEFRNKLLNTVIDPSILYYWHKEYPILKSNSIGSILTRLDTFLRPKSIRYMVVQKKGLDFERLLNTNKIILCKLSQGLMGKENSYLLGSLLLSKIHQAIFRRQQHVERNPVFLYIDEFQNFITPSITEMLSGIRKYNAGLILSHQDLHQLQREDGDLVNSVLGNCTTRVVFRVGEQDARKLQDGFTGFECSDLQNLGRGEAVVRIEQPQYDCSLDTASSLAVSSEQRKSNLDFALKVARDQYATPKHLVEEMLSLSLNSDAIPVTEPTLTQKTSKPTEQTFQKPDAVVTPIFSENKNKKAEIENAEQHLSTHRYLETLVKKMAEARGYVAIIEAQIPNGNGQIDVLLSKENKTMAVEICITTDPNWEMHNIEKCLSASYDLVVSLSGDPKQLDKIRSKCRECIPDFNSKPVKFFTPDAFFAFLDDSLAETIAGETVIKGYRVNVTYDAISPDQMARKRASIAQVVMNSLKKKRNS